MLQYDEFEYKLGAQNEKKKTSTTELNLKITTVSFNCNYSYISKPYFIKSRQEKMDLFYKSPLKYITINLKLNFHIKSKKHVQYHKENLRKRVY